MKIICIGRNYANHAKELNNPIPSQPLLFMKPSTALLIENKPLYYPNFTKNLHYEAEIVLKISRNGRHVQPEYAHKYYDNIAFGIDFTARDLQSQCKEKGHPWEIAKAFDHSAALSPFIPLSSLSNPKAIQFTLNKNSETVQTGDTSNLLFSFPTLIAHISKYFTLLQGDLLFTGTPAGVGPVQIGDTLQGYIEKQHLLTCEIR